MNLTPEEQSTIIQTRWVHRKKICSPMQLVGTRSKKHLLHAPLLLRGASAGLAPFPSCPCASEPRCSFVALRLDLLPFPPCPWPGLAPEPRYSIVALRLDLPPRCSSVSLFLLLLVPLSLAAPPWRFRLAAAAHRLPTLRGSQREGRVPTHSSAQAAHKAVTRWGSCFVCLLSASWHSVRFCGWYVALCSWCLLAIELTCSSQPVRGTSIHIPLPVRGAYACRRRSLVLPDRPSLLKGCFGLSDLLRLVPKNSQREDPRISSVQPVLPLAAPAARRVEAAYRLLTSAGCGLGLLVNHLALPLPC